MDRIAKPGSTSMLTILKKVSPFQAPWHAVLWIRYDLIPDLDPAFEIIPSPGRS
jgi:hypothetical protein